MTPDDLLAVHELRSGDTRAGSVPLVLLHGFPLAKESWDAQVAALTEHARVIRVDLRGLGGSSVPLGPGEGPAAVFFGGGLGIGVSMPLSRHVAIDLGVRDYLTQAGAQIMDVVTAQLGVGFTVGGPPR